MGLDGYRLLLRYSGSCRPTTVNLSVVVLTLAGRILALLLLSPASPQGLIELDKRKSLVQLGLHQVEFR